MIGFKSIRGTAQIQILRSTNNASFAAVGFLISFDSTVLHTSVRNTGSSVRSEIWQTVSMETHLALVPAGNRLTALMSSCRSSSFQLCYWVLLLLRWCVQPRAPPAAPASPPPSPSASERSPPAPATHSRGFNHRNKTSEQLTRPFRSLDFF